MDASKIFMVFAVLILCVCLVLALLAVGSLRNAVEESRALQGEVMALGERLDGCIAVWEENAREEDDLPTAGEVEGTAGGYVVRTVGERIAVYTNTGALVRLLEINPAHLPAPDREALAKGIALDRWEDVLSLIEDYSA